MRQVRAVAVLAQMTEIQVAQLAGNDLFGGIGGSLVGKMPVPAEDALFDAPGAAQIVLEHFHVVIGFEHKDVRYSDPFDDQAGGVSEISEESDTATTAS